LGPSFFEIFLRNKQECNSTLTKRPTFVSTLIQQKERPKTGDSDRKRAFKSVFESPRKAIKNLAGAPFFDGTRWFFRNLGGEFIRFFARPMGIAGMCCLLGATSSLRVQNVPSSSLALPPTLAQFN
jgi:hypothetical protein